MTSKYNNKQTDYMKYKPNDSVEIHLILPLLF